MSGPSNLFKAVSIELISIHQIIYFDITYLLDSDLSSGHIALSTLLTTETWFEKYSLHVRETLVSICSSKLCFFLQGS